MENSPKQISAERKTIYYVGISLAAVGALLFLSVFLTFAFNFGNMNNFDAGARSMMLRAVVGMLLLVTGRALATVGARGAAGAGLLLDPQRAREDLQPWTRMGGGMVQDALGEVGLAKKLEDRLDDPAEIKVRCTKCHALNDEAAKFCDQCGAAM